MKYFSTSSARVTTVRKEGYYPSARTAYNLCLRLQVVLQWSEVQTDCAQRALEFGIPSYEQAREMYSHHPYSAQYGLNPWVTFTASEIEVLQRLTAWWGVDTEDEREKRAFIVCDLNRGISLCILSKERTRGDSSEASSRNGN
jgi:hypothetical protein